MNKKKKSLRGLPPGDKYKQKKEKLKGGVHRGTYTNKKAKSCRRLTLGEIYKQDKEKWVGLTPGDIYKQEKKSWRGLTLGDVYKHEKEWLEEAYTKDCIHT